MGSGEVVARLKRSLKLQPVVARRHYSETGTMRCLDVGISRGSARDVERALRQANEMDGRIVYAIPDPGHGIEDVFDNVRRLTSKGTLWIVAIPRAFKRIKAALREAECWSWVSRNVPELKGDRAARREVQSRHMAAKQHLAVSYTHLTLPTKRIV